MDGASSRSNVWRNGSVGDENFRKIDENIGKGNFWAQYKALVLRNFTLKLRERRKTITVKLFMCLVKV